MFQLFLPNLLGHISIIQTQNVKNVDFLLVWRQIEILLRSDELDVLLFGLLILSSFEWYFGFSALDFCFSFGLDDFFDMRDSFVSFLLFSKKLSFGFSLSGFFGGFSNGHDLKIGVPTKSKIIMFINEICNWWNDKSGIFNNKKDET